MTTTGYTFTACPSVLIQSSHYLHLAIDQARRVNEVDAGEVLIAAGADLWGPSRDAMARITRHVHVIGAGPFAWTGDRKRSLLQGY
jgi:hypothetical protein